MAHAQSGGSTGRQKQPIAGSQRAKQQPPISFNLNVDGSWRNGLGAASASKPKSTQTQTSKSKSKGKGKGKGKGKIKEKEKVKAGVQQKSPLELIVVGHRLTLMRPMTMRLAASCKPPARTARLSSARKQEQTVHILEADEFIYVYDPYPADLDLWPGEHVQQPPAVIDARFLAELFDELIIGLD